MTSDVHQKHWKNQEALRRRESESKRRAEERGKKKNALHWKKPHPRFVRKSVRFMPGLRFVLNCLRINVRNMDDT